MNTEKYIVRLSDEERQDLEKIVKKLKGTSQKVNRALALLHADADGPDWTNEQIHELTGVSIQTIANIRKQLVPKVLKSPSIANHVACRQCLKNSTVCRKPKSSRRDAVRRPKVLENGHFDCLPTKRWFWKLLIRSVMKRFARR